MITSVSLQISLEEAAAGISGVRNAIIRATENCKTLIRGRIRAIGRDFPEMWFAVKKDESPSGERKYPVYIAERRTGIPLSRVEEQYPENEKLVVLTPCGIAVFNLSASLCTGSDLLRSRPNSAMSEESNLLWILHAEKAIRALWPRKVIVRTNQGAKDTGKIAAIGEDFCRHCGHIAPAEDFLLPYNRCPNERCDKRDDWNNETW